MEGFYGQIIMFAGAFAPKNWAFCDGQILSIDGNEALYSILGTTYGGNGTTNFGLPDLRGRVPIGAGIAPNVSGFPLGYKGGSEYITIGVDNLPSHDHAIKATSGSSSGTANLKAYNGSGDTTDPSEAQSIAGKAGGFKIFSKNDSTTTIESVVTGIVNGGVPSATEVTGGGQALPNMQPFQVVNYIICVSGAYPARN